MKISANSIKLGNILVHENDLWIVVKNPEHTQPGKGGAYVQVEMKNLRTGIKLNTRFSSSEHIERARLEGRDMEFLYFEGDNLVLMDKETFEQTTVNKDILGDKLPFLKDNMEIKVEFYEEKALSAALPATLVETIEQTEPVIKGSTATSSYKPAILSNGIKVAIPSYLVPGDKIIVKTEDLTFVGRAK